MSDKKRDELFKKEMKPFNIEVDDIEESNDLFSPIEKAIMKMREQWLINRLEVILNENLIETKDKYTNYRTILGCKISYDNLPKDVSFIVRPTEEPTYEDLQQEIERLNNIINELEKWLKEHSNIDYNCKETIIHEQLALNTAYEYLKALKEKNK